MAFCRFCDRPFPPDFATQYLWWEIKPAIGGKGFIACPDCFYDGLYAGMEIRAKHTLERSKSKDFHPIMALLLKVEQLAMYFRNILGI